MVEGRRHARVPLSLTGIELQQAKLCERLRRSASASTVPGSLPVLFFGDLFTAEVATVGLNPSDHEYLTQDGVLLNGQRQRFATINSLGAMNRASLSDGQCAEAIQWMRNYYDPGRPVYGSWFNGLARVIEGFGASFQARSCAHLDLVQESTTPVWSRLPAVEQEELLNQDLPFLEWEIRTFPLRAVICNGKKVGIEVQQRLGVSVIEQGTIARIKWWVGHADLGGRRVGFGGWNIPLARPTGLGRNGEAKLGELLAQRLCL